MNVVLFGFKGCGKSYFGAKLSRAINLPFIDTDTLLVEKWKRDGGKENSPPEIYRVIGEGGFRELESKVIASLADVRNSVIAVGGGTVLNAGNVLVLSRNGRFVFLDTTLETILSRKLVTALGPLEKLYKERYPIYTSIEAVKITPDTLTDDEVINALTHIAQQRNLPHGIK
jgi:shikimate kinase